MGENMAFTVARPAPTATFPLRRASGAGVVSLICCPGGDESSALLLLRRRPRVLRCAISKRRGGERHEFVHQPGNSRFDSWRLARVISGEAEGNPSIEGMILDEEAMQRDLEIAIREEDYARAAELRDRLRVLHEDSKAAVLSANSRFYHAFKNGDLAAMYSVWAKGDHVYVVHPGAGRLSGYDLVMGSWEIVCNADYEFPLQIDLKNVEVHVRGDIGYVTCTEVVKTKGRSWGKQVATNVFEMVDGQWFICGHHASHIDG